MCTATSRCIVLVPVCAPGRGFVRPVHQRRRHPRLPRWWARRSAWHPPLRCAGLPILVVHLPAFRRVADDAAGVGEHRPRRPRSCGWCVICLFLFTALILSAMGFRARPVISGFTRGRCGTGCVDARARADDDLQRQVNLVLAVIVVGCDPDAGGGARRRVGLAAGIKLTPIFFVAYFAITRQFRAMATAMAVFVATVVIGLDLHCAGGRGTTGRIRATPPTSGGGRATQPVDSRSARPSRGTGPAAPGVVVGPGRIGGRCHRPVRRVAGPTSRRDDARDHSRRDDLVRDFPIQLGHHWVWFVPLILIAVVAASDARRDRPATWVWWLAPAACHHGHARLAIPRRLQR